MSPIRIVTASAFISIILFVSGSATGTAAAQNAADGVSGKPLQLTKIAGQPQQAKKPHARSLAKSSAKSRLAAKSRAKTPSTVAEAADQPAPALTAEQVSSATIWPAANALPPTSSTGSEPAPAWPATAQAATELVVAGQSVQVVPPDKVNELDLAAKAEAAMTGDALPEGEPATVSLEHDMDGLEPKADSLTSASAQQPTNELGSTSWILQVLAALGGAATAASLAWFLIGSTPQRMYG